LFELGEGKCTPVFQKILKKGKKITPARKQTQKRRTNPCGNIFETALTFLISQQKIEFYLYF